MSDIIQLVVLVCADFFAVGHDVRHSLRLFCDTVRSRFVKPRYIKPAGTLTRAPERQGNR
ncbi:cellulose biosynthesis protein BcsF [Shigella flexneri]